TVRAGSERQPLPVPRRRLRDGRSSCRNEFRRCSGSHPVDPQPSARNPLRRKADGKGTKGNEREGKGRKRNTGQGRRGKGRKRNEREGKGMNHHPSVSGRGPLLGAAGRASTG